MEKCFLEFFYLLREDERLWDEVEVCLGVLYLHLLDILRQLVFPGQLEAERKVVDLLSWGQALVEVGLALRVRPQHVPIMPVRAHHTVELKNEADELGLALEHFVEAKRALPLCLMVGPLD